MNASELCSVAALQEWDHSRRLPETQIAIQVQYVQYVDLIAALELCSVLSPNDVQTLDALSLDAEFPNTTFKRGIPVTGEFWNCRVCTDSIDWNCGTVNTRYRHTRYRHSLVIGTKTRVYQLSPAKTSSIPALAHLVTGTQKTILCL